MTGAITRTFVEDGLLDGKSLNETLFYQLLNIAKTSFEEDRDWHILITEDSSKTVASGDTYLTMKDLPSDFAADMGKLYVADSDGSNAIRYFPIKFEDRRRYKDASRRYYIDLVNGKFALTGNNSSAAGKTIFLPYRKTSADINTGTSWVFPSRFHGILGFLIAEMHKGGIDYDQVNARQLLQHRKDAMVLYQAMIDWDSKLVHNAMGGSYAGDDEAYDSDGLPARQDFETPLGLM